MHQELAKNYSCESIGFISFFFLTLTLVSSVCIAVGGYYYGETFTFLCISMLPGLVLLLINAKKITLFCFKSVSKIIANVAHFIVLLFVFNTIYSTLVEISPYTFGAVATYQVESVQILDTNETTTFVDDLFGTSRVVAFTAKNGAVFRKLININDIDQALNTKSISVNSNNNVFNF